MSQIDAIFVPVVRTTRFAYLRVLHREKGTLVFSFEALNDCFVINLILFGAGEK